MHSTLSRTLDTHLAVPQVDVEIDELTVAFDKFTDFALLQKLLSLFLHVKTENTKANCSQMSNS